MELSDLFFSVNEIIGTVSFAVSGAMIGIQRRLDAFGVLALGMITAFGGGVIRDLLIGCIPPRCFYNFRLLAAAFGSALVVFVIAYILKDRYFRHERLIDNINNFIDALGLAAFTVSGVQAAFSAGHFKNPYFCIFLGMLTGVGGGILRDIMSTSMPMVFRKRIYATASIAGGGAYYICLRCWQRANIAVAVCMVMIIAIRVCATVFRWSLPRIKIREES